MRLSRTTLPHLPADVERPDYDSTAQRRGIVHLGLGAFHRAHQAAYTDRAMAAGDCDWAITGVSLRSPQVHDALAPQDGLYTLTERDASAERTRVIGAIRDVLVAPRDPAAVVSALAARDTHVVTLTITEKGYGRRPDGTLDPGVVNGGARTIYYYLRDAFAARRADGHTGLTLVSCDNLSANGAALHRSVAEFLDAATPDLRAWFEAECTCPSTMVDRIVPAVTGAERDALADRLGLSDEAAVFTEPFHQWVIEDRFAGPRPHWEAGGAQFVADVGPYETAKLRLLNGAHSALGYLGLARGLSFVHEAVADPAIRPLVERLMRVEAAPTIGAAVGQDLPAYIDALLRRFANPTLAHRLDQIATDGSQKIGPRWLERLASTRAQSVPCEATLQALAAWIVFVRGDRQPVSDPLANQLTAAWREAGEAGIVEALFAEGGLLAAPASLDRTRRATLTQMVQARVQGQESSR
ncbi:mannitol dehydrogenase family protein [Sphingomonas sp.]|uniref:mannitol dehydrogenase family protein n=1 Tax=Sphingomonas sp. TaxID=28214 RepID=UPI0035C87ABD